jgi:hypothetical protein
MDSFSVRTACSRPAQHRRFVRPLIPPGFLPKGRPPATPLTSSYGGRYLSTDELRWVCVMALNTASEEKET